MKRVKTDDTLILNENNYHYQLKAGEEMLTLFVSLTIGIYGFIMYYVLHHVSNPKQNPKKHHNPVHVTR
ncbi:hypothetical protein V7147_04880 [Bacillus sp. JJ1521]|uniref:hypothetical protein n=1 Tax=Bacillus sp. JJ1521 TaxID=3122957 RepID=UPI002FFE4F0C